MKKTTVQTIAHVGIASEVTDMSVKVHVTSPMGCRPDGVTTSSAVQTMSPIVTSVCAGYPGIHGCVDTSTPSLLRR